MEVTFDQPVWESDTCSRDIYEDFYRIAKTLDLTKSERDQLYENTLTFDRLAILLARHGYSQPEQISTRLIEIYSEENSQLEEEIETWKGKKILNNDEDRLNSMIGSAPPDDRSGGKALRPFPQPSFPTRATSCAWDALADGCTAAILRAGDPERRGSGFESGTDTALAVSSPAKTKKGKLKLPLVFAGNRT